MSDAFRGPASGRVALNLPTDHPLLVDGGFGNDAVGGMVDAVPGASKRGLDKSGGGPRITEQDDCGRVLVPNRRGGMPIRVCREDRR